MKKFFKPQIMAVTFNTIVAVLFLAFFVYLGHTENVEVYSPRPAHDYATLDNVPMELLQDDTAPVGVRRQYRWTLDFDSSRENCLCFYTSHHYVDIYIGGELVYSLRSHEDNRIADSPADNWAMIPLYQEDLGREITVVLIPLFENVVDQDVDFLVGSHFSILFDQVKLDLSQLFLATLCILLGIFLILVQLYLRVRRNAREWDMLVLGVFSIMLGLWRMTDIRSAPLLFPENTLVLGHIATASIFLLCCFLPLFISTLFQGRRAKIMLTVSVISSVVSLLALAAEVFTDIELKETLVFSHVMLVITVLFMLLLTLFNKEKGTASVSPMLLVGGVLLDLILYYTVGGSGALLCTLIAFIIYMVITIFTTVMDTSKKAYTDPQTGLYNKSRWLELIEDDSPFPAPTSILMIDLNGLKRINDTLGHEAGDKIIFTFANILHNTLPPTSVICRWGGDEFTAMMIGVNRESAEEYISQLRHATEDYNRTSGEPCIYFAAGLALSTEHPELSRKELMQAADNDMYQNKLTWYESKMANRQ